ncbi:MAG: rhomboid family intramembrane serine protease [Bacteroidales bacterium]|nr:MAG: rhomboid family intramembrane serine protease [Bacteroidales bacterium]
MSSEEKNIEKKRFLHSLVFPLFFLILLWLIKFIEIMDDLGLVYYGINPRKLSGLIGVLTAPLIHGSENLNHIIDNSIPLFFLSLAVFYFYNKVAYRIFFLTYFITGFAVWLFARPAYHIGASGLIYGFGSFLFFSGIIRQNINLLAISLLVVFLYGSMVWGIFPYKADVSWEGHFLGGFTGFILSIIYRNEGPQKIKHEWEEEEEDDEKSTEEEKLAEDSVQEPDRD